MTIKAQGSGSEIMRPSRTRFYMDMAYLFAGRSTCLRGHVGCVAVRDNHLIAGGFNGAPAGMDHCLDVGCGGSKYDEELGEFFPNGCTRAVHAEMNMVAWAARHGTALNHTVVFSTHGPCIPCAQALVTAGIKSFHYVEEYRVPEGKNLLINAGITVTHVIR